MNIGREGVKSAAPVENVSFMDVVKGLIDIVNPLQHIPIVSSIYRRLTGDEIGPIAEIAGGGLFGGPIGAAMGLASATIHAATGKDMTDNVLALMTDDAAHRYAAADKIKPTPSISVTV